MTTEPQCAAADVTAETLSVEEVSLCTEPLHYVHTLLTEVTGVAAAQSQRKLLPHAGLKHNVIHSTVRRDKRDQTKLSCYNIVLIHCNDIRHTGYLWINI